MAHPDYPLFLPVLITWVHLFTGPGFFYANWIMPVLYMFFTGLFYSQIRRYFNHAFSFLIVFMLASIPQVADYAMILYSDILITAFVTCAFIYFMQYADGYGKTPLLMSAVLMGLSAWIKNEAIVFCAAYVVVLAVFLLKGDRSDKKRVKDVLRAVFVMALVAVPWMAVKLSSGAFNSDMNPVGITPDRFLENVRHIPVLLDLFQQEVFGPKKWNIFWVLFFAAMIWRRKKLLKGTNLYMVIFLSFSACMYFAAYMLMTGENLYFYINTTISRFMLHFTALAMFFTARLVYDDIWEIRGFRCFK
ncbi:MAG: glycosyltransferase family 39 protein [Candidatus Omnitrophota bacterium]